MPQLTFLTLFLGLISGVRPVAVSVAGQPAAVEFVLDGRTVAHLTVSPWWAQVDFGTGLAPHSLSARALDAAGKETARIVQLVNLPRAPAEASLELENASDGRTRGARIRWQNLVGAAPLSMTANLDGKDLAVAPDGRVALPSIDPAYPHVLSVDLRFANGIVAHRDAAFGGDLGAELRTEITAVPVRFAGRGRAPELPVDALRSGGLPVGTVANEDAAARVVVVRDPAAVAPLLRLQRWSAGPKTRINGLEPLSPGGEGEAPRVAANGAAVHFLWPQAAPNDPQGLALELFESSREFGVNDPGAIGWLLTHVLEPRGRNAIPRFADAVAVAGLHALNGNGRRAVLLILNGEPSDPSQYDAEAVEAYLRSVHVPLFVWRLERTRPGARPSVWGEGELIATPNALSAAIDALRGELAAQKIVWIEGARTPQDIELTAAARVSGWRFAGEAP